MNKLDVSTMEYFLNRFYQCHDSIIRCIALIAQDETNTSKAEVILSVRDKEKDGDGWVNLNIKINGLTEFIGSDSGNYTDAVLSDGVKIGFFDNLTYIDFEPFTDEPRGIEDYKKSKCLIIGKEIFLEITSYSEKC